MPDLQYNDDLSRRRAEAVARHVIAAGVSEDKITIHGHGESQPIAAQQDANDSDNAEGRQRNRRVEVNYNK